MKKFFPLFAGLTLSLVAVAPAAAEIISPQVAKTTADRLLSLDSDFTGASDADVTTIEQDGMPVYYLVEYNAGGWAIISAQSSVSPLIAYNPTGTYAAPEPMQAVLNANKLRIADVARSSAPDTYHKAWKRAAQRKPAAENTTPDVAPIITVNLNQGDPYNAYCPSIGGTRALVGCVAVGMGQAMMAARYPERPVGSYSYTDPTVGYLSIDYDAEEPYDWDAMYNGDYDEIARLLYHCGVSVDMQYGVDGSGAYTIQVATALPRNFQYDKDIVRHVDKPGNNSDEWVATLLEELVLGRVIIYHGNSETSGHCWNIDGWRQATQMFHVNWGWGGTGNAYFNIDAMQDSYQGMSFPYNNGVVIGVGAPTTAPYALNLSTLNIPLDAPAGYPLADVTVSCEDADAVFEFTVEGPLNIFGKRITSPYTVQDMKLVSTETVTSANKFTEALITVTNTNTGESYQREFVFSLVQSGVESVLNDHISLYPTVASQHITLKTPFEGGSYAIYNMSGAQVAEGAVAGGNTTISVTSLPAGTYLLRYVGDNGVGVKTFIVK